MKALGFDVGATSLRGGLVDDDQILQTEKRAVPRAPEALALAIDEIARALDPSGLLPLGVGIAAMIPTPRTHLERAPNFGWDNVPLKALLEDKTGRDTTLLNDLEAILLGESRAGAARGRR